MKCCFSSHDHDEVISGVLSASKKALELGKSALEFFSVPGLAPAADVLIALIDRVEEVRTTQDGLEELSGEVSLLVQAVKKMNRETEEGMKKDSALGDRLRSSPELPDRFIEFRDKINGLKTQADELYKGPFFLRCFYSSRDTETLKKLQRGVTSALNYFNLLGKLEAWAEGHTLADTDLPSKPICILTGGVGTRKSTIASEFAKRLDSDTQPRNAYGASFFFDCQVEDLSSTKFFFRQPTVMAARNEVSSRHPGIVLVVDAVDECKDEDPPQLVPRLLDILVECVRKAPFPLRVFITSRPDHHSRQHILSKHSADVHRISLDDLSLQSVTDDISTFLRNRFSQTAPGKRVLEGQPQLIEGLASLADRNFLVARIAMETLESNPRHFEVRLQQLLADPSVREGSLTQPTTPSHQAVPRDPLDGLYLSILETAFPSGSAKYEEQLRVRLQTVLGCIALLGSDHLSLRAIEAFTSVSPNDSLAVLTKLRSVVLSDGDKFLVDPTRCTNSLYLVDKPREHARIAQGCLNAVMSLAPNSSVGVAGTEGRADRVKEHVSPHVRYACLHWASHLGEAKKTAGLTTALDKFATPQTMRKWVETVGHLGRLDVAEAALDSASKWEEPNNPTRGRLDKARQLVADHYEEIEKSPGAVYSFKIKEDSGAHHNPAAAVGKPVLRKDTEYFDAMLSFPGGLPKDSV
ncbi:hypothetical protein V8D89_002130 [Ganoderma adspersum]